MNNVVLSIMCGAAASALFRIVVLILNEYILKYQIPNNYTLYLGGTIYGLVFAIVYQKSKEKRDE